MVLTKLGTNKFKANLDKITCIGDLVRVREFMLDRGVEAGEIFLALSEIEKTARPSAVFGVTRYKFIYTRN